MYLGDDVVSGIVENSRGQTARSIVEICRHVKLGLLPYQENGNEGFGSKLERTNYEITMHTCMMIWSTVLYFCGELSHSQIVPKIVEIGAPSVSNLDSCPAKRTGLGKITEEIDPLTMTRSPDCTAKDRR